MDNKTSAAAWAIYLRVSDENKQHPERSVARQQHRIRTVLLDNSGLSVYREYTDYVSGLRVDRSEYQQLMADAHAGHFSHLAIAEASRFGRDLEEWMRSLRELIHLGVKIKPADMPSLDVDTPDGFFIAVVMGGLAEREVKILGQRVRGGMQEKLRAGGWPFKSPDGYLNKRREISSGKWEAWVEPDPERAPMHSLIFDLYATRQYTLLTLAEELNRQGHRNPNGQPWSPQGVHRRLTNPFYVGRVESKTWGIRRDGIHEPLTTPETWERCQQILGEQSIHSKADVIRFRHHKRVYPLVGILWSKETGGPFTGTTCRGNTTWVAYYRTRDKWQGKRIYVQVQGLHQETVPGLLAKFHITDDMAEYLHRLYRMEIDREVEKWFKEGEPQRLRQRIVELEREQRTLLRFALKELVSEEEYKQEQRRIQANIARLRAKLATIEGRGQQVASLLDHKLRVMRAAEQAWNQATPLQQRALGRQMFERIVIDHEGNVVNETWSPPVEYLMLSNKKTTVPSGSLHGQEVGLPGLISNLFSRLFEELEPIHLLDHQPALVS